MRRAWFRRWGWIYRPIAMPGWAVLAAAAVFCVRVFVAVDGHSHSASDTFYGIVPYFVSTLVIVGWIASRTSNST